MSPLSLPAAPADVLNIPDHEIATVVRDLIGHRKLSPLMRRINAGLSSENQTLRQQSRTALDRLGFPE
ncbi:hypothetical protein [Pacificoceanicola onchidii]|uniref:hypothetical protein n=1 Tax=Pacificoceanicola onchidii TaxID=2562685 RepID=UPI0010A6396D|nr:hypothetical protein [Pacificoceanicola onchidii]